MNKHSLRHLYRTTQYLHASRRALFMKRLYGVYCIVIVYEAGDQGQ